MCTRYQTTFTAATFNLYTKGELQAKWLFLWQQAMIHLHQLLAALFATAR